MASMSADELDTTQSIDPAMNSSADEEPRVRFGESEDIAEVGSVSRESKMSEEPAQSRE
jgi:hypothetical protein